MGLVWGSSLFSLWLGCGSGIGMAVGVANFWGIGTLCDELDVALSVFLPAAGLLEGIGD